MSTAMWKLEKDLCRCCHAEGSFKHLSDPCFQLGQEEIYSDMLQDCLDIKIIPMTGVLSDVTYTICESCVVRLRDAANFKRQVQDCEERFKEMYSKNLIRGLAVKDEPMHESDDLKQEFQSIDEDDDDAFMNFDDDAEDSLEDRPLSVEVKPKLKGKAKAKPKPKAKKTPAKKTTKEKPIKLETEELTEAAVSGERKKGRPPRAQYYTVTTEDKYACNECEKSFVSQPLISQHYRFVHLKKRPKDRKCPHCDERVPGHLRAYHLEDAHGIPAPSCGICNKKFRFQCKVLEHQKKVHMGEKTVACKVCSKSFFNDLNLRLHMATHSNVKKYKCEFCSREFRWVNNLKDHVKIHVGDKRYTCPVCDKAFIQKSTLKQHALRNHRGVDVFKAVVRPPARFNTNFTLTLDADGSHIYTCDECGNGFKKRTHFSQHYRHVHLKLRPKLRACYLCNVKVPAHMRAFHLESEHGWPAPSCGACGKKFAYPFQVLKHQKIDHMGERSYSCEICNMKFSSKYRLKQHSIKHTEQRKYMCTFCGKSFRWKNNLKTHVMIHLDDRAFVCSLCDEAFVQQSSLKYHLSKRHPEFPVEIPLKTESLLE